MKKMLSFVCLSLIAVSLLSGCNTFRGAGEDIERGGEAVQNAAS